jgi:signal transduction histidine kinase/DNA-binding response OmpR family regulator
MPDKGLETEIRKLRSRVAVLEELLAVQERTVLDQAERLESAMQKAIAATDAKARFLANMSHEIRTPMNAIVGMTELVLDTELDATQRDYLSVVSDSAESLLSIINEILDFSKIEAGKFELEALDFDVCEEVGDTLRSLALRAQTKGLELSWRVAPEVPGWLRGDPGRLRQMLTNLVGNALKFTEAGEVVVDVQLVEASGPRVTLQVSVRDTGIGIPEEQKERIFAAFEQADSSTTRRFGGTGLGLAIASHIVTAMNGRLWVESEPGQGSTFHFTMDLAVPEEPRAPSEPSPDLRGLDVLIVDDNRTNRRILIETLRGWGIEVAACVSGEQVLERLAEPGHVPQLLISDFQMPGMDGEMLAARVRAMPGLGELPIILLTSGAHGMAPGRVDQLDVSARLMKPVKRGELRRTIANAVDRGSPPPGVQPRPKDADRELRPLRVLLAEDGVANQKVAMALLGKAGHEVVIAQNGDQAITRWREGGFDAVLMDVQMPILDGLEATRRIREEEKASGAHVPIIAVTARAMASDRAHCLEAGMDGYLAKPVREGELRKALAGVVFGAGGAATPRRPEEPRHAAVPLIAWDAALEIVGGDRDLLREVLDLMGQSAPDLEAKLEDALGEGDLDTARRIAHTLKGEARAVASDRTAAAAAAIEASAAEGDLATAQRLLPGLSEVLRQLILEIEAAG